MWGQALQQTSQQEAETGGGQNHRMATRCGRDRSGFWWSNAWSQKMLRSETELGLALRRRWNKQHTPLQSGTNGSV